MTADAKPLADESRPWIGLASFTEGEREFFAGRDEEIAELLRLVRRDTLTLLYGVSGLGKTSLLQAGIFPVLREGDALPVLIRLDHAGDAPPLAAQVHGAIARAAEAAGVECPKAQDGETLWEYFHRHDNDFWSRWNAPVTPVLIFDQFEEIFTLGRETPERIRRVEAFVSELAELVENRAPDAIRDDPERAASFDFKPGRLKVVLSMREDYLAELDRLRSRFRDVGANRLRLLPMGERQARAVIALGKTLLAPGVEDRILAFVAGREPESSGEDITIAPALLSLVLRELNERRLARGADATITADLLGLEQTKILECFYLRSLEGFPAGVRLFVEDALLTAGGYRNSCALDDALAREGVTQPILDELVNRRLLAYENRQRNRRVELAHDVLVPVIKAGRDTRRTAEEAQRAELARKAEEERRLEAERKVRAARRQLVVAAALLALAVAGGAVGFVGFLKARQGKREVVAAVARGDFDIALTMQGAADFVEPHTLAHLARAVRNQPETREPGEYLVSLLRDRPWCLPITAPLPHSTEVMAARFGDEAGRRLFTVSREGIIRGWDVETGKRLSEHRLPGEVTSLSADGRRVVTVLRDPASKEYTVQVWDAESGLAAGKAIRQKAWGGEIATAGFSADGQLIAGGASLSADGKRLVIARRGFGGDVTVWDAVTGDEIGKTGRGEGFTAVQLSRDGRRVVVVMRMMEGAPGGSGQVWEVDQQRRIGGFFRAAGLVVLSPDGRRLAVADDSRTVELRAVESQEPVGKKLRHSKEILDLNFSPDGERVVTASMDKTARIWDAATGDPVGAPLRHQDYVGAASFSADGRRIVTASWDRTARIWDAATGKPVSEPLRHEGRVAVASFSADGQRVVTGAWDKTARVWEAETRVPMGEPLPSGGRVDAASFSPDGKLILTASRDRVARLWEAESARLLRKVPEKAPGTPDEGAGGFVTASFSPDGRLAVAALWDNAAWLFGTRGDSAVRELKGHTNSVVAASFSSDGQKIVTASRDQTARVWHVATGEAAGPPLEHSDPLFTATFSPDGRQIVTTTEPQKFHGDGPRPPPDNSAHIWDAITGQRLGSPLRHEGKVEAACFSPDGRRIVTASYDFTAGVWDAESGRLLFSLRHEGEVVAACYSPDGKQIVTASLDNTAQLWDAATGARIGERLRHENGVSTASFRHDSLRVVTASFDATARVWDTRTGKLIREPMRHENGVVAASFSPDGRAIVTGSWDRSARTWNAAGMTNEPVPPWLAELAEALGGRRFNHQGLLEQPAVSVTAMREKLRSLSQDDYWSRFGRWFIARGPQRTITPDSALTLGELERHTR